MNQPVSNQPSLSAALSECAPLVAKWIPPADDLPPPFNNYSLDGKPFDSRSERRLCQLDRDRHKAIANTGAPEGTVWMMRCSTRQGQTCAVKFFSPPFYERAKVVDEYQRLVEGRGPFLDSYGVLDLASFSENGTAFKVARNASELQNDRENNAWLPIAIAYQAADLTLGDALALLSSNGWEMPAETARNIIERMLAAFVELVQAGLSHLDIAPRNIFLLFRSSRETSNRMPSIRDIKQADCVLGDFGCAVRWDDQADFVEPSNESQRVTIPVTAATHVAKDLDDLARLIDRLLKFIANDEARLISQLKETRDQLRSWAIALTDDVDFRLTIEAIEREYEVFRMDVALVESKFGEIDSSNNTSGFALDYRELIAQIATVKSHFWVFGTYLTALLKDRNPRRGDVTQDDCNSFKDSLRRLLADGSPSAPTIKLYFIDPFSPYSVLRGNQLKDSSNGSGELIRRASETILSLSEIINPFTPFNPNATIWIYDYIPAFFLIRVDDNIRLMNYPVTRSAVEDDQLLLNSNSPAIKSIERLLEEYGQHRVSVSLSHYFSLPVVFGSHKVELRYLCLRTVSSGISCRWIAIAARNSDLLHEGLTGCLAEQVGRYSAGSRFRVQRIDPNSLAEWTRLSSGDVSLSPFDRLQRFAEWKYGFAQSTASTEKFWELNWDSDEATR